MTKYKISTIPPLVPKAGGGIFHTNGEIIVILIKIDGHEATHNEPDCMVISGNGKDVAVEFCHVIWHIMKDEKIRGAFIAALDAVKERMESEGL